MMMIMKVYGMPNPFLAIASEIRPILSGATDEEKLDLIVEYGDALDTMQARLKSLLQDFGRFGKGIDHPAVYNILDQADASQGQVVTADITILLDGEVVSQEELDQLASEIWSILAVVARNYIPGCPWIEVIAQTSGTPEHQISRFGNNP